VRYEDREVEGAETDRKLEHDRETELEVDDEHEMPEIQPLEVLDDRNERKIVEAMRAILDHRMIVVNDLALPKRELDALVALKEAVDGKDGNLNRFVFAEDRQELLEQALAVLQPQIAEHMAIFGEMVARVANVRQELRMLEDAEDELIALPDLTVKAVVDSEDDDQSLDGPERNIAKPKTSLDGAEVKPEPFKSTLADGPAVELAAAKSTLSDGAAVQDQPAKSTLFDGPAAPELADAPTTLGDAKEIEKANESKRPWWKLGLGKKS
jgi:hypothetical protein